MENKSVSAKPNRLTSLDSLKGIAIIFMTMVHSNGGNLVNHFQYFFTGKSVGHLLILISGFLVYMSYDRACNKPDHSVIKWYIKRFLRLIPIYYICNIYNIFWGESGGVWAGSRGMNAWSYISNFLFLNGFDPWTINVIGINWYIGCLASFILVVPLIRKFVDNWYKALIFLCGSYGLYYVSHNYIANIITEGDDRLVWYHFFGKFSLLAELVVFAMGIMIYYLIVKESVGDKIKASIIASGGNEKTIMLISYILIFTISFLLLIFTIEDSPLTIYGMLWGLLVFVQLVAPTKMFDNRFFSFIGKYSLGVYLINYSLLELGYSVTGLIMSESVLSNWISIAIAISVGLLFTYLLTKFVEKPICDAVLKKIG